MINLKRINLICGHYGSGKTNVAVNLASMLAETEKNVAIADLDIVNPYFRSKDSERELTAKGIRLICSNYANSNVDIPALPQDMYAITDDKSLHTIIDVGGDERGALALGRISKGIIDSNDYDMFLVVNCYRPLTKDVDSTIEVMQEIEQACKIKFTGIINNSNLGNETTAEIIYNSLEYAKEIEKATNLKVKFTAIKEDLVSSVKGIENILPLNLQKKIF